MSEGQDLIRSGSVLDIKSSLKCSWNFYDVKILKKALAYEQRHDNRATVIKMLQGAIKRKEKEGPSIHWYFLYWSDVTKAVYQGDAYALNERHAREYFESRYAGDLLEIRRGKPFSDDEIASWMTEYHIDMQVGKEVHNG